MNDTLFSFCANIFGFVVGGISLLGFIVAVCRPQLPINKIRTLETLLHETEITFSEAVEAGLLVPEFVERTEENLTGLKEQTLALRALAYNATTFGRNYAEFLRGTSTAIGRTCQSVKKLRAEVITSSQERRHRLMQTSSEQNQPLPALPSNPITQPPPALPSNPMTQHHPTPTPFAMIPRPQSCPPTLSGWEPDDVRNVPIDIDGSSPSDPFGDSSRCDSDVRIVDVQLRT